MRAVTQRNGTPGRDIATLGEGRRCRAIEIDPGYVAVAIQLWADATGKVPELIAPAKSVA